MRKKVINNNEDYQKALKRLDVVFNARKGTKEGEELEFLSLLIYNYENKTEASF